jgi:DNA end-binding protein Ku
VVLPCGPALVLNLLRWGGEIRSWDDLPLPAGGKAGIKDAELKMAKTLIADMSGHWSATEFRDNFHEAIMKLVEKKAKAGDTETVEPLEEAPAPQGADVIDLTELLRRSLKGGAKAPAGEASAAKAKTTRSAAGSRTRQPAREHAAAAAAARKRAGTGAKKTAAKKTPSRARRAA